MEVKVRISALISILFVGGQSRINLRRGGIHKLISLALLWTLLLGNYAIISVSGQCSGKSEDPCNSASSCYWDTKLWNECRDCLADGVDTCKKVTSESACEANACNIPKKCYWDTNWWNECRDCDEDKITKCSGYYSEKLCNANTCEINLPSGCEWNDATSPNCFAYGQTPTDCSGLAEGACNSNPDCYWDTDWWNECLSCLADGVDTCGELSSKSACEANACNIPEKCYWDTNWWNECRSCDEDKMTNCGGYYSEKLCNANPCDINSAGGGCEWDVTASPRCFPVGQRPADWGEIVEPHKIDDATTVWIRVIDETPWVDWLPLQKDEIAFWVDITESGEYQVQFWDATNTGVDDWNDPNRGVVYWGIDEDFPLIGRVAFGEHACTPGDDLTICDLVPLPKAINPCNYLLGIIDGFLYSHFKKTLPEVGIRYGCTWKSGGSGGSEIFHYTTSWRLTSINDFKGIPIIKIYKDGDLSEPVKEKAIPTYFEVFTVYNVSNKTTRKVSDPFGYAHYLILDEDCNVVGGDFPQYGVYERQSMDENPVVKAVKGGWKTFVDLILPGEQTIETPMEICRNKSSGEGNTTYGIVDAGIWQDTEVKLPDGNTIHYLINQREYSTYDRRTCKDYDWEKTILVHQTQYEVLAHTFFREEEFYEELYKTYVDRYVDFGVLNPLYMLAGPVFQLKFVLGLIATKEALDDAQAKTNQMYCFKTHLKEHLGCYALNYEWYTLTDVDSPADPRAAPLDYDYFNGTFYRSPYFDNVKRWNYDQKIVDMV